MIPTLVLLLKAPQVGRVKTRLAAGIGAAAATTVYRQLVERQLRALPGGWPTSIHFDPPGAESELQSWLGAVRTGHPPLVFRPQPAGDLGARLTAAFAAEFAAGARAVIALGGDCPALDAARLQRAASLLARASTDAVLGPAADGGYFLLGLRAPCPELFAGIAWSTPAVLAQTRKRLHALGRRSLEVPTLEDVDDAAGWHRAVADGLLPPLAVPTGLAAQTQTRFSRSENLRTTGEPDCSQVIHHLGR